jgi:CDP-paratose 2-epimerase
MNKTILITGCNGLIGSECVRFFGKAGYNVVGIDNNMRQYFFGKGASTAPVKKELQEQFYNFKSYDVDIRDVDNLYNVFKSLSNVEMIIHTAAQPSHDWAVKEPITDFTVNALGTLNLLELYREYFPQASFVFTSTNKVYGDRPNKLPLKELDTRYESYKTVFVADRLNGTKPTNTQLNAINEEMSIDDCTHSVFGASKVAADIMVQEYGKYFGLNTVAFRGGCLTGPHHQGAELHGFLSYLIKCMIHNKHYTIFGYKGKQVRDNIHSYDLVNMFWNYHLDPKPGAVYNAGGGRENSTSILEAIESVNKYTNLNWSNYTISDTNRIGDHIWYISDLTKFKNDYPKWNITISLENIIQEMCRSELNG